MAKLREPVTFLRDECVLLRGDAADCLNRFVFVSFVDMRAAFILKWRWTSFFPDFISAFDFRCYFSVAFSSIAQVSQTVDMILLADHVENTPEGLLL